MTKEEQKFALRASHKILDAMEEITLDAVDRFPGISAPRLIEIMGDVAIEMGEKSVTGIPNFKFNSEEC